MASPTRSSTVSFWNFFRGDFLTAAAPPPPPDDDAPSSDSDSQSESCAPVSSALVDAWQRGLLRENSARLAAALGPSLASAVEAAPCSTMSQM